MIRKKVKDVMLKKFEHAKPDQHIEEILDIRHIDALPVIENNQCIGLLDYKKLLTSNPKPETTVKKFIMSVADVHPEEYIPYALQKMVEAGLKGMPVVAESLEGFLCGRELAYHISQDKSLGKLLAVHFMTRDPVVVDENESIGYALSLMRKYNISRLPVIDENGKVSGVLSLSDVIKYIWRPRERARLGEKKGEKDKLTRIEVKGLMYAPAITATIDTPLKKIGINTKRFDISDVIVVDENEIPIGIITVSDILRHGLERMYIEKKNYTIAGHHPDPIALEYMEKDIQRLLRKGIELLEPIYIHIKPYRVLGIKKKYAVTVRVFCTEGLFRGEGIGWDITKAFEDAVLKIERQIVGGRGNKRQRRRVR